MPRTLRPRRLGALLVAVTAVVGVTTPTGAQVGPTTPASPTVTPTTTPRSGSAGATASPGRIAWVTPTGDVVVAESDGSSPVTIGSGAAANAVGLSPLAWSPGGSQVAYVRTDGALVLASASGQGEPQIVATDAVVPPGAGENLLSFDITGASIAYVARGANGVAQAMLAFYDGRPDPPRPLSDPSARVPLEIQYSPLDPYLYLRSADVETGRELTIAVVEPFTGVSTPSPYSVDDPVFAPDGKVLYGVVTALGEQQLARLDSTTGRVAVLTQHERVCKPSPSPDGALVAFGAGPQCDELWVIAGDGTDERLVTDAVAGTFAEGVISWSLDGATVSHAACQALEEGRVTCGGEYLDIAVKGGKITNRALAGSVRREQRPLIKALKVKIDMTGPLEYHDRLLVSRQSVGQLLENPSETALEARGADERAPRRIFSLRVVVAKEAAWIMGTLRVQDPSGFDQTVTFIGSALVQSYRYATVRGIWVQSTSMPMKTGRLDLVVYR